MEKERDLIGQRFGRLTVLKQSEKKANGFPFWLCRCDCGSVNLVSSSALKSGNVSSCGCLVQRDGAAYALCPACGNRFIIMLNGDRTPQFCQECASKYTGRNWKVCPICGSLFPSPASDKTVTCSKACSSIWRSASHGGVSNRWGAESRARKRLDGRTNNLRLGTEAAKKSPVAGRFKTNQWSKVWTLIDPVGNEITVQNLLLWARENTERFGKPKGDRSASQIAHGFAAIAETLRGTRKTPAMTYFGWTLKAPPDIPK